MLQILNHIYSWQLWIIICVDREPYVDCELFVMLLIKMLRHFFRVFSIYVSVLHQSSANVFITRINELSPFKKKDC